MVSQLCCRTYSRPPNSWHNPRAERVGFMLRALHSSNKSLHSSGDLLSIFQEGDGGVVNNSSSLHHLAPLFRLCKLASPLQDIPLQKHDQFIGVRSVAEKLSSSGPIGLTGDTVCVKR